MTTINKVGADWLVMRSRLFTKIADLHKQMEQSLTMEEYHAARGGIALARELIEWVEPSTPVGTTEEDYGMLDPNRENYG